MKTQVKGSDTKEEQTKSAPGKHRFAIEVDGDNREYFVHIPQAYDGSSSFPVVLMLHGSGGNGEKFYNISGWVQQGEDQNIITVFPSAWKYDCVEDDGVQKHNAEKWTGYDLELCDNVKRRDDVKFLGKVIEAVSARYNTQVERVYMVGFSNGGEMAARCAVELSDNLAAVVACAGSLPSDTTWSPLRRLPVLLQIGAADANMMAKLGTTSPLPLNFPKLLTTYPQVQSILNSYIHSFGLKTNYTATGNPGKYIVAKYPDNSGARNAFEFAVVKDLEHEYPNGRNHPMYGAKVHWSWMKNYQL